MTECGMFDQPTPSALGFKVAPIVIIAAWALVLVGLSGCLSTAPPPTIPAASATEVLLEPTEGPVHTPTPTGRGAELSPRTTVSSYPVTPEAEHLPPSATARAAVEATPSLEADSETPETAEVVATQVETRAFAQDVQYAAGSPPKPTATKSGQVSRPGVEIPPTLPVGAATTQVNIRGGPGTDYPVLGFLETGQSVQITGVCPEGSWWQVLSSDAADERGWVSAAYLTTRNTENVPIVQPPALPAAPVAIINWRAEYFANRDLTGRPALVRDDPHINFDWGGGPPAGGLPVDDFSARWTRAPNFSAGTYRFYALVDDGARLWIDGNLVIDQWHDSAPTTYTADAYLDERKHNLVMEYCEHTGNAVAQLTWDRLEDYPGWKGEYFSNPGLNGAPVLVRNDANIDFSWADSPGPGVPGDNFSARWTRTYHFPGYVYRFDLIVDDGARLWVDDRLIIDGWRAGAPEDYTVELGLSEGPHTIKLEYFEFRYGAQIYLNWQPVQDGPTWEAEYFDNRRLDDDPVLERDDGLINFIWGTGSPGPDVPADNFSARWRQDVEFEGGTYIFSVWVDDGVRLWVDGGLLIDSWQEGRVRLIQAEHSLSHGTHYVKIEYFERSGHAQIEVSWGRK